MTACKVELVLSYFRRQMVWSPMKDSQIHCRRYATWKMGYQKLYFENSTYKYYVRKHMQVFKNTKRLTKNILFSAQEWRSNCYWQKAALQGKHTVLF